jgi:glycosyltransferase involved in cell wall biosynthesis
MAPDELPGFILHPSSLILPASLRFGILCRFTEQKGIAYIIEALKLYQERHGAVDFTFAGQGPMEREIKEFVEEKSVSREAAKGAKGSHFSGPEAMWEGQSPAAIRLIPVTTAVEVLSQLDVFIHPGLDDAMPVSIVEALMCGLPCVVSNVGAAPELVRDGVEGRVIEPASAAQICEAMERFAVLSAEELAGYKARARARYEAVCRPAVVGKQVSDLYREVGGGRSGGSRGC